MTKELLGYIEGIVGTEPRKWNADSLPVVLSIDSRYLVKSLDDARAVVGEAEKIGLITKVQKGLHCEIGTYELAKR